MSGLLRRLREITSACRRSTELHVVASGGAGALDLGAAGFRGDQRSHPSRTTGCSRSRNGPEESEPTPFSTECKVPFLNRSHRGGKVGLGPKASWHIFHGVGEQIWPCTALGLPNVAIGERLRVAQRCTNPRLRLDLEQTKCPDCATPDDLLCQYQLIGRRRLVPAFWCCGTGLSVEEGQRAARPGPGRDGTPGASRYRWATEQKEAGARADIRRSSGPHPPQRRTAGRRGGGLSQTLGRVLARDQISAWDLPNVDNLSDGRATPSARGTATRVRPSVRGYLPAGRAATESLAAGTAAKILTGAPIPTRADSVVPLRGGRGPGDAVRLLVQPLAGDPSESRAVNLHAGDCVLSPALRSVPPRSRSSRPRL